MDEQETEFDRAWKRQRPGAPTVIEELVEAVFKSMFKEHMVLMRLDYIEGQLKKIGDAIRKLFDNDEVFVGYEKDLEKRLRRVAKQIKALTPETEKPIKRKKRCASPTSTTSAAN